MANVDWTINDNSDKFLKAFEKSKGKILSEWGLKWQEIATGIVTAKGVVDTGKLRNTLGYKADVGGSQTYVGSPLDYAIYNELGTSKMAARPFIVPAIKDNGSAYADIVSKYTKI